MLGSGTTEKGQERAAGALRYLTLHENIKHVIIKANGHQRSLFLLTYQILSILTKPLFISP